MEPWIDPFLPLSSGQHGGLAPPEADPQLDYEATRWDARRVAVYAGPTISWWETNPHPVVYTASGADPDPIGVCMNNAWYAAATGDQTFAVYADESASHLVHLVRRPHGTAYAGDWLDVHTCTNGSYDARGAGLGFPCLAMRRLPGGRPVFALAWRAGRMADELWATHRGTDSGTGAEWEEVDVAALAGLSDVGRFCLAMDDAYNTWLVFSASNGADQRIYLSVRPAGGTWSTPTEVYAPADYTDGSDTYTYDTVDFPSVAVSGDEDPNGPTVLVVYAVEYNDSFKRVLGKSMRVADVEAAGWSMAAATEVDVGGSVTCRDPCVAATRDGTFVVAYTWPTATSNIQVRYTTDPVAASWSAQVEVCPDSGDEYSTITRDTQNFASVSIDGASGLCFVCWEDAYGASRAPASSNGAVAALVDLSTWTPLGVLTGRAIPATDSESTRYPCVVATAGRPRVFYREVDASSGFARLVSRSGSWS